MRLLIQRRTKWRHERSGTWPSLNPKEKAYLERAMFSEYAAMKQLCGHGNGQLLAAK